MSSFSTRPILANQTVGERLQKVRAGAGLTVAEVSRHTGVKREYLQYIENGQYNDLPGDIYAIEFIKKYARFLAVDYRKIIEEYYRERSQLGQIQRKKLRSRFSAFARLSSARLRQAVIWGLSSAFAVVLAGAGGAALLNYFFAGPELEIFSPVAYYKTQDSRVVLSGSLPEKGELRINGELVALSPEGQWQEVVSLPVGQTLLKISASNARGKTKFFYRSVVVENTLESAGEKEDEFYNEK